MFNWDEFTRILNENLPGPAVQWQMAPAGRGGKSSNGIAPEGARKSAVLVPLRTGEMHPQVVLTVRNSYDGVHSGQVSFPGGKFEKDETDPIKVAQREAFEETGLLGAETEILGMLTPLYIPVSNMWVQPVVGKFHRTKPWNPDPREVQKIIEVQIPELLDPLSRKEVLVRELSFPVPAFAVQQQIIWGATAMMLSELAAVIHQVNGLSAGGQI